MCVHVCTWAATNFLNQFRTNVAWKRTIIERSIYLTIYNSPYYNSNFYPQANASIVGPALDNSCPFCRYERNCVLSRRFHWSLVICQTMHCWRIEGKARPREDEMALPARFLTRTFWSWCWGFGPSLWFFSVISSRFSEPWVDQWPIKLKAEFRTPIANLFCVEEYGYSTSCETHRINMEGVSGC